MNPDFRSRVLMPILLPLGVIAAMAAFVGLVAYVLLFNTHNGALAIASLAAGGILFTVSLAATRDRLDPARRAVVVLAAALPFVGGGLVAAGVVGGVDDAQRNINVEPLEIVDAEAPVIAAETSADFCIPEDEGRGCDPVEQWELGVADTASPVTFTFDNREAGVPHNVVFASLGGSESEPEPGDDILESELITGPETETYTDESLTWEDLDEQWYFYCRVHPNMSGVAQLAAG